MPHRAYIIAGINHLRWALLSSLGGRTEGAGAPLRPRGEPPGPHGGFCHGSPAQTNEFLYESALDDARRERWLDQYTATGLVCTHSGFPWIRRLPQGRFALNCGVCGKPDHDHDAAVHYATVELRAARPPHLAIERVEYDHLAWADQLDREGVDDVFTTPIRNGVWTCGLLSMPPVERVLRPRPPGWSHPEG